MPIATKIAPVGKSYSALDLRADVVVCANGGAKILDNIEIIAVSRDLRPHTRHVPLVDNIYFVLRSFTARPIFALKLSTTRSGDIWHRAPNDVNVVGVLKKLDTLVENRDCHTLHGKIEEFAR